jgi:serine/threonine protein kinase
LSSVSPQGSLRQAITEGLLDDRVTGLPHYPTILSLALDIANAMLHLHSEGVVHGDLKAGNVLLRSAAGGQRRSAVSAGAAAGGGGLLGAGSSGPWPGQEVLQAKVADFGLASQLQEQDTHISGVHRVSDGGSAWWQEDGMVGLRKRLVGLEEGFAGDGQVRRAKSQRAHQDSNISSKCVAETTMP